MELNNEEIKIKKTELTLKDVKFLSEQSGLPKISIINLFSKYFPSDNTSNGGLNREQFLHKQLEELKKKRKLQIKLKLELMRKHLNERFKDNIFNQRKDQ